MKYKILISLILVIGTSLSLSATSITVTDNADSGQGSLRAAIASTEDTIFFKAVLSPITLSSSIQVLRDVVIIGNGPDKTIVQGDNTFRLFDIPPSSNPISEAEHVTFTGMSFKNGGSNAVFGGAIIMSGTLTIDNCLFDGNQASKGGAIFVQNNGGNVQITNSIFSNNSSTVSNVSNTGHGGAVHINPSSAELSEINTCLFYNNSAEVNGGAIMVGTSPILDLYNNTIVYNTAADGGGVYAQAELQLVKNNLIANNLASSTVNEDAKLEIVSLNASHNLLSDTTGSRMMLISGNIETTPTYVDAIADNYRLASSSAGVDVGNNTATELKDLDNKIRQVGTRDIGAYEYHCVASSASTIYVDSEKNYGSNTTGLDWGMAYPNLQDGIDATCDCPASLVPEIWVAKGTYRPSKAVDLDFQNGVEEREKTFFINHPTKIYGGFPNGGSTFHERSTSQNPTILSGDIGTLNDHNDNAYHVMYMSADSISSEWLLDGLIIRDGRASLSTQHDGAGLCAKAELGKSNPEILNCIFENNIANGDGGGVFISSISNDPNKSINNSNIKNCNFQNNTAENGGGIFLFVQSVSTSKAKISTTLENCIFYNNKAHNDGGGLNMLSNAIVSSTEASINAHFINCTFNKNTALNSKGGAASLSAIALTQNGIPKMIPTFDNCTITNNSASEGGGIHIKVASNSSTITVPIINNSILWGNYATNSGTNLVIENSDLNDAAIGTISHSVLNINSVSGDVNYQDTILRNPLMVDTMNNDLRLMPGSPAINAGINDSIPTGIIADLDSNNRIRYGTIDMGAYEGVPCLSNDILYVDIENTNPTEPADGTTWSKALTDLQEAINISNACGDGKEIWAAKGSYRPTEIHGFSTNTDVRGKTFYISEPVQIYGGFAGSELTIDGRNLSSNHTILTGDLDNDQDTVFHVVTLEADTIDSDWQFDGLIVRDGLATGDLFFNRFGAGIYVNTILTNANIISPLITNCSFINNYAQFAGGAMYAQNNSLEVFSKLSPEIYNCVFSKNTAGDVDASGPGRGGAFYLDGKNNELNPKIINCTFSENKAQDLGGAIYFQSANPFNSTISNSIFWSNMASNNGDDIYGSNSQQSGGIISHSTLSSSSSVSGMFAFQDTLLRDPLFIDAANNNLQLSPGSPAFNYGDNTAAAGINTDLAGKARLQYGTVDMGAYEYRASCSDALRFFLPGKFINTGSYIATDEDIEISSSILNNSDLSFTAGKGMVFLKDFEIETGSMMLVNPFNCAD